MVLLSVESVVIKRFYSVMLVLVLIAMMNQQGSSPRIIIPYEISDRQPNQPILMNLLI